MIYGTHNSATGGKLPLPKYHARKYNARYKAEWKKEQEKLNGGML